MKEASMTYKILLLLTSFSLSCLTRFVAQASCEALLPQESGTVLKNQFPEWKVVTIDDLGPDEQSLWHEKHGNQCPGIIEGQFGPSAETSYAVTLIHKRGTQNYQILLLLYKYGSQYKILTLSPEEIASHTSVLTKIPPGKYSDWDSSKTVRTHFDAISYEAIEVGAVMFYWNGSQYRTLQLSE
jgi:hypothetical protein